MYGNLDFCFGQRFKLEFQFRLVEIGLLHENYLAAKN